ncbi:MAG: prepilin-type N-terminal cleavage/methylation domain-containing protein [Planctomycetes bacterium]|nr:prepilin-type N-terminal cleavage/methylation domain-containing protein [Planctomycetota bacterium]MBI3844748.1 prepilin-type N-terminal cleavage/methylation domain-containing protein [Planctomycetota bacterium]
MSRNEAHRARGTQRAGFTLLELMIGTVVMSVSLIGMLGVIESGFAMSRSARELSAAKIAAVKKLEQIRELSRTNFGQVVPTYSGTSAARNFAVPPLSPTIGDADGLPGRVTAAPSALGGTKLLDVTVRIDWRGGNGARSYELTSRLSNN